MGVEIVCGDCGILVGRNKAGRLLHLDALPQGAEVHDAFAPMTAKQRDAINAKTFNVDFAATMMLQHHGMLHPLDDCEWAARLAIALKAVAPSS